MTAPKLREQHGARRGDVPLTRADREARARRDERRAKRRAEAVPLSTERPNVPLRQVHGARSGVNPTREVMRAQARGYRTLACAGRCGRTLTVTPGSTATSFLCSPIGGRGCAPLEMATNAAVATLARTGDVETAIATGRRLAPAAPLRRFGRRG